MLTDCREMVRIDIERQNSIIAEATQELKRMKNYEGSYLTVNQGKYYCKNTVVEGKRICEYLGTAKNEEVRKLQRYRYLSRTLRTCRKNVACMEKLLRNYRSIEPEEIMAGTGEAYKDMEYDTLVEKKSDNAAEIEWYEMAIQLKATEEPFRPHELIHTAADGTKVRTRIELEYYNELIRRKLAVVYELPMYANGHLYHPDITVFSRKLGRPVIIEHFGYMGVDPNYAKNAGKKIFDYLQEGYTIGVDLLIFFETADGRIDTESIFRELNRVLGE